MGQFLHSLPTLFSSLAMLSLPSLLLLWCWAAPAHEGISSGRSSHTAANPFPSSGFLFLAPFLAGLCFQALPQCLMAPPPCQTGKGHLVQISGKSNILYFFFV